MNLLLSLDIVVINYRLLNSLWYDWNLETTSIEIVLEVFENFTWPINQQVEVWIDKGYYSGIWISCKVIEKMSNDWNGEEFCVWGSYNQLGILHW